MASACWSDGETLLVSSPQKVTGSMMILVYWRHCAAGLKYRRPACPFATSPGVRSAASLPRKPEAEGVALTAAISVVAQPATVSAAQSPAITRQRERAPVLPNPNALMLIALSFPLP